MSEVLVLNRNYQAIRVIGWQRALSLLFRDIAEVLTVEQDENGRSRYQNFNFADWKELSQLQKEFEPEGHDWVHAVHYDLVVPRIIRLMGYDRLPRQEVKFNRRNIYARDSNRCQYCGKKFPTEQLNLDHVIPRTQGGKSSWDNIVCSCIKCNMKKGGRTPEQANMRLIAKPVRPKRSPVISLKLASPKYASWKQFLDQAYWSVELR